MSGGESRRRVPGAESTAMNQTNDTFLFSAESSRPVSWHASASSYLVPPPMYQPAQHYPRSDLGNEFYTYDLPQTPAVYSGYTSPATAFSPVSMPYNDFDQQQYPFSNPYAPNTGYPPSYLGFEQHQAPDYITAMSGHVDQTMYTHFDWSNSQAAGFISSTSPPTPENFLPIQHPAPGFESEEAIAYHALSDDEPEGEELVGLGLYDSPEVPKSPFDPQLDPYRTMISQIMGPQYRRPESTGKGLKLEETWTPPSDDEDDCHDCDGCDDDEDEDEDGEGEDDDEASAPPAHFQQNAWTGNPMVLPGVAQTSGPVGWL